MSNGFPFTVQAPRQESVVLKWWLNDWISRSEITIAASVADQILEVGTVLGQQAFGMPVVAPKTGNTGAGGLSGLALGATPKLGAYSLICTAAAGAAASFAVLDPLGRRLADAAAGTAYAQPDLAFTIAQSGADFAVGDAFTVTVPAGTGNYVPLNPIALDGSQIAAAVLTTRCLVPAGQTGDVSAITGYALVNLDALIWPSGIAAAQTTAAIAQLAGRTIFGLHQS